ncbi:S1 RNA-binding domain-containing protein [Winogradskya consettensis]|uniref:S1 RNA-binding domain-containing protein n=1 Tax=Winogradskya consettensis TaxID=113560 RepID=UPI001BB44DBB|nr:S1 RNA-binding domain-containing protein [Actinoplanes consettensis]
MRIGETVTVTVTGFEPRNILVQLDGPGPGPGPAGRIPHSEMFDAAGTATIGQTFEAETISLDPIMLSARACANPAVRAFLLSLRRGQIISGTVTSVRNFGVFLALDGEPAESETGFIQVPELTWSHISSTTEVVEPGRRVTGKILDIDTRRAQVSVSLKALQPDPFLPYATRVGETLTAPVTKVVPFGSFIRLAPQVHAMLRGTDPYPIGTELTVTIAEVDLRRRRIRVELPVDDHPEA